MGPPGRRDPGELGGVRDRGRGHVGGRRPWTGISICAGWQPSWRPYRWSPPGYMLAKRIQAARRMPGGPANPLSARVPAVQRATLVWRQTADKLALVQPGPLAWAGVFGLALANWLYDGACLAGCVAALGLPIPWQSILVGIYGLTQVVGEPARHPGRPGRCRGLAGRAVDRLWRKAELRAGGRIAVPDRQLLGPGADRVGHVVRHRARQSRRSAPGTPSLGGAPARPDPGPAAPGVGPGENCPGRPRASAARNRATSSLLPPGSGANRICRPRSVEGLVTS